MRIDAFLVKVLFFSSESNEQNKHVIDSNIIQRDSVTLGTMHYAIVFECSTRRIETLFVNFGYKEVYT